MDTHTAQINDLKSQLTNFVAHAKNNCISHAQLGNCHGRKKSTPKERKKFLTPFLPMVSRYCWFVYREPTCICTAPPPKNVELMAAVGEDWDCIPVGASYSCATVDK
ncbi:hypothetical protein MRX96_048805 [Rhipicephalus microplus]